MAHDRHRIEGDKGGEPRSGDLVTRSDDHLLPRQLKERGIVIAEAGDPLPGGAAFILVTNESILRRPVSDLVSGFTSALA